MGAPLCSTRWLALLVIGITCLGAGHAFADDDLAARVAHVVDLPDAKIRRDAADALAGEKEITVEALLAAMRDFGLFSEVSPGVQVTRVPLARLDRGDEVVVYVPPGYDPTKPAPALLALHGAGGNGGEMVRYWQPTADAVGMLIVAPTDPSEEGFRFTDEEREASWKALRWARRTYNIDENRISVTGVSRGAHLAWDLALRRPDRFAALAAMIGGPRLQVPKGQNNIRYVENVAHLPIRDLQGRDDDPRLILNLQMTFERLVKAGAPDAKLLLQSGFGHGFDIQAVDWPAFFREATRDPHPARVVRRTAREGEGRAFWVDVLKTKKPTREEFPLQVAPAKWNALADSGKRKLIQALADQRTARMEVRRRDVGRFEAASRGVKKIRLLLTSEDFVPGESIEVLFDGRRLKRRPKPSKSVLLREFAERFDRTFLPVAEVRLP